MDNLFTLQKLKSFSLEKKHKKASELLRRIYDSLLKKESFEFHLKNYSLLESDLNLAKLAISLESISDRFHLHLTLGKLHLKEHSLLDSITKLDTDSDAPYLPIDIYLDNIRSAHNIGSIIRTTEALRIGNIHFSQGMAYIDQKKVLDAAMGTSSKVTCFKGSSLSELKQPLIAVETSTKSYSIHDFIFPKSFSLLLGNEEYGLSCESLKKADIILSIPMYGFKNSLNVACAFSLIAGEIRRQAHHATTD